MENNLPQSYLELLDSEIKIVKKSPLSKFSKNIVIGDGDIKARIMIVGQNPGAEEDKIGKPFIGRSGKFLNKILEKNNIKRESVYITNVVNFKTPENREPTKEEIEFFMPLLLKQIQIIKPKTIILLGKVSWQIPRLEGIKYIETYHPSAAMRFTKFRKRFEEDFSKIKKEE